MDLLLNSAENLGEIVNGSTPRAKRALISSLCGDHASKLGPDPLVPERVPVVDDHGEEAWQLLDAVWAERRPGRSLE